MTVRASSAQGGNSTVASQQVTGLTPYQIVFPDATSTLSGSPVLVWNDTTKTEEIGMGGDIKLFNTTDKVTNREYLGVRWFNNVASISTYIDGGGAARPVSIGTISGAGQTQVTRGFTIYPSGNLNTISILSAGTGVGGSIIEMAGCIAANSNGLQTGIQVNPQVVQTGTAGYTALDVNPTETSVGSGAKLLQRWAVAGATKSSLDNTGNFTTVSLGTNFNSPTTSTTLTLVSPTSQFVNATTAAVIITLPAALSVAGRIFAIKKTDASANSVTISANGAETIDGSSTKVISTQYTSIMLQSNGGGWFILSNN